MARINFEIPDNLHKALRFASVDEEKTLKSVIIDTLNEKYLNFNLKNNEVNHGRSTLQERS